MEQWSIVVDGRRKVCLYGAVYGHPVKADGTVVITSPVTDIEGPRVMTRSGTVYELGESLDRTRLGLVMRGGGAN